MKRVNYKIGLSILVVLILTMVTIIPASADPPGHSPLLWEDDGIDTSCGFAIPYHIEVRGHYTVRCNEGRELCGDTYHWNGYYTITYNDHTMNFHGSIQERFTWINWGDTLCEWRGARWKSTLPGHGVVFGTVGRLVIYETCEGEWPNNWVCEEESLFFSGMVFDDQETVCNYMLYGE